MGGSVFLAAGWVAAGVAVLATAVVWSESGGPIPEPVSPRDQILSSCPTFSWAALPEASGYELLVHRVETDGAVSEEPLLEVELPAGARAWSPSAHQCLAAGTSYAWLVRGITDKGPGPWSEAVLFETAAGPSDEELVTALRTLGQQLRRSDAATRPSGAPLIEAPPWANPLLLTRMRGEQDLIVVPGMTGDSRALSGISPAASLEKAAPTIGSASMSLSGQLHFGAAGNVIKDGALLLWDDDEGNLALGENALALALGSATNNTAVGRDALFSTISFRNTAVGDRAATGNTVGYSNTATGFRSLHSNTTGNRNTAIGSLSLEDNVYGNLNTAIGYGSLLNVTVGQRNVGLGVIAGANATAGNDNIFISNSGSPGDSGVIRIGIQGIQTSTSIGGIWAANLGTTAVSNVQVRSDGRLGTNSCGSYMPATVCPLGTGSPDGPTCDRVPVGSFCESDGECGTNGGLDNCGGADWYLRVN